MEKLKHCKIKKCSSPNPIYDLNENLKAPQKLKKHKCTSVSIPTFELASIASLDLRSLLLLNNFQKFFSSTPTVVILCFKIA